MCGRFVARRPPDEIARVFKTEGPLPNVPARYNVAPGQDVLTVLFDSAAKARRLETLRWGLIPSWAKDAKIGYSLINAKAETCTDKPSFREAFKSRRCIVPADAFYEWKPEGKKKQPHAIMRRDRAPLAFAGLWERWQDKANGESIRSCTIITTTPNAVCVPIHDRMPVILDESNYARWLGEEPADSDALCAILKPCPSEALESYPVDARVGKVRNEGAELMEPMAASSRCAGLKGQRIGQRRIWLQSDRTRNAKEHDLPLVR
jgi:putative SOS response-associated peptidase YedK